MILLQFWLMWRRLWLLLLEEMCFNHKKKSSRVYLQSSRTKPKIGLFTSRREQPRSEPMSGFHTTQSSFVEAGGLTSVTNIVLSAGEWQTPPLTMRTTTERRNYRTEWLLLKKTDINSIIKIGFDL